MTVLLAALCLAAPVEEETFSLTLAFRKMHCAECRIELEAGLKRIKGARSVAVKGTTATVAVGEASPLPALSGLPRDLELVSVRISIRGTVSRSGDKTVLVARSNGATLGLVRPARSPGPDRIRELHDQMGGKNRFVVRGALAGGRSIVLESFAKTDWKDE